MTISADLRDALLANLDEDHAVGLLRRAVQTPSITGDELAFARLLAAELEAAGADEVHVEEIEPGRPIVWSVTRGTGPGTGAGTAKSLLLAGHLDTVRVEGWAERWQGTEREDPFGAAIVDGAVWGRGAADLKGGIAAAIAAIRTVHRSGARLQGDLVTAWICDEESGEPGLGRSIGMRAVAERIAAGTIPKTDFAIYVEPTTLDVYPAQIGFLIADVALTGRSAYFGRPEEGVDALRAAHRVLAELWAHADEVRARDAHPLLGRPALLVTELSAGGYIAVPGDANLSLIRTLTPSEDLGRAAADIASAVERGVEGTGVSAEVTFPAGRDHAVGGLPSEMPADAEPIERLRACIHAVAPGRGNVAGAPFWSEASFLAAQDIPCAYFAPGDIANCHTPEEHVVLREFLDAAKALSLFIAGHCGAGRIEGAQP
ncbi:MAG TPA: M20/M25/M40 family metallo-hydrolase [Capillimicrobium sp.]|nr:M20/M25/M40 family metallo-hydrolase [Capillimicrobium sp.]